MTEISNKEMIEVVDAAQVFWEIACTEGHIHHYL